MIDFLSSFDFRTAITTGGFIFGLFSFVYKNVESSQLRALKNITDIIEKINEICIDLFLDKKNTAIDKATSQKIFMYINILEFNFEAFPVSRMAFIFLKKRNKQDILLMVEDYKELILDTPIENPSISLEEFNEMQGQKRVEKIIHASLEILRDLEHKYII